MFQFIPFWNVLLYLPLMNGWYILKTDLKIFQRYTQKKKEEIAEDCSGQSHVYQNMVGTYPSILKKYGKKETRYLQSYHQRTYLYFQDYVRREVQIYIIQDLPKLGQTRKVSKYWRIRQRMSKTIKQSETLNTTRITGRQSQENVTRTWTYINWDDK